MGMFLNPGNEAFQKDINNDIYVDKTDLISSMNRKLDKTDSMYVCVSRPRRFGKSMTANMLAAYYSQGCDSAILFSPYKAARAPSFQKNLNQFDVIHIDVQWCRRNVESASETIPYIQDRVIKELKEEYPHIISDDAKTLSEVLASVSEAAARKFIVIIDEWDSIIRDDAQDSDAQELYIDFLRIFTTLRDGMTVISLKTISISTIHKPWQAPSAGAN